MSDKKQLDAMWTFAQMGGQKSNVPCLIELCEQLRHAMTQKTGGQEPYKKKDDVPFEDVETIVNCIVIETLSLYLSGDLKKLQDLLEKEGGESEVEREAQQHSDVRPVAPDE